MEPQKSVSKSTFYMVVLFFFFLFLALIIAFVLLTVFVIIPSVEDENSTSNESDTEVELDTQESDANDIDSNDQADSMQFSTFSGDYVTAELPEGWEIVEYVDGAGTDMLPSIPGFLGLTGLEVINPQSEVLFSLGAVDGIGGASPCEPIYSFEDTDPNYILDETDYVNEFNAAIVSGDTATLSIMDLSEDYSEFSIFDQNVRRIDHKLYFDNNSSSTFFDPACKIDSAYREFSDLGFNHSNYSAQNPYSHTYKPELNQTTSESDLEILDVILDSLEAI